MSKRCAGTRPGVSAARGWLALAFAMAAVMAVAAAPASADTVIGQTRPGSELTAIACASGSALNCVAVGAPFASQHPVDEVTAVTNGVASSPRNFPAGFTAVSVACTSATSCLVVGAAPGGQFGREGALVEVTNGAPGAVQLIPGTGLLHGIECNAANCLAVGQASLNLNEGVVVPITSGVPGSASGVAGTESLYGIDCHSAGNCVAVGTKEVIVGGCGQNCGTDYEQAVTVAVTNGSPGSPQSVPNSAQTSYLFGVACPASAAGCVAVGENDPNAGNPGTGMVVPITGGAPGAPQPVSGTESLRTLVCQSATSCLAGGLRFGGPGGQTTGVLDALNTNGSPGTAQDDAGLEQVTGLACADASNCLATGYTGYTDGDTNKGTGLIVALGPPVSPAAAIASSLKVSGPGSSISAILRSGGFPAPFTAPAAGSVAVTWYYVPAGATLTRVVKPVVVAKASKKFSAPGKAKVKLRLTAKGRKLLKHAKRIKLTAVGTFTPKHGKKASRHKAITLK